LGQRPVFESVSRIAPSGLVSQFRAGIVRDKYATSKGLSTWSVRCLVLQCSFSSVTQAARRFDIMFVWEGLVTLLPKLEIS